ncbi:MAG: sporulation protein YunB [Clostridia bacterium]|nr:sporulation protein YunB [Clostridia bacterium]
MVAFSLFVAIINPRIKSVVRLYAQSGVERMCYEAINSAADTAVQQSGITYSDIVRLERGTDNSITAVMTDIIVVNRIKTLTTERLLSAISSIDGEEIDVCLGTLTGNALLNGRGPEISVRVQLTGSAEAEIRSKFETSGINQTRHIIVMDVSCRVYSTMLGGESVHEIFITVPIAETIIVGSVPDTLVTIDNNGAND